uniref:BAH domain-containing protein n=1 Tax=Oryza glumipatula TaxID=40148 RepID=A0A0E0A8P6_9ORYZ
MGSGRERKRRRRGEMGRVAEMVMAAELLARPRELFPREAVRALVEDLGLARGRDPSAMGYRPRRASIAERILLTKRKMEEIKEAPVYPTTNVSQTTATRATTVFQHGASKPTTGLPMNISAVASFPVTTPPTIPSPNILKQTQLNESPSGVKAAGTSSIVSVPSVGPTNIKVEKGVNSPTCTQNGATIGQANKSAHLTATMSNPNIVRSSSHEGTPQHEKAPGVSENRTTKDNNQELAADGTVIDKNSSEANRIVHNSDKLALESSKEQSQSGSASAAVDKGRGKPQGVETMENNAISERGNVHELTSNGDLSTKNEIVIGDAKDKTIVCSTDHSIVGWVGDPLRVVENKTYYYSCNIDGIAYNLDDHILVASKDKESAPSKLQSLWEEHDSRSKMALVSPYFFASDIPELISKPCTAEENEVFASCNQRTVTVSAICGQCEVLHVDKFREETKGSQVVSSRLHPIFLCSIKSTSTPT